MIRPSLDVWPIALSRRISTTCPMHVRPIVWKYEEETVVLARGSRLWEFAQVLLTR
jgi:hypothetical protein